MGKIVIPLCNICNKSKDSFVYEEEGWEGEYDALCVECFEEHKDREVDLYNSSKYDDVLVVWSNAQLDNCHVNYVKFRTTKLKEIGASDDWTIEFILGRASYLDLELEEKYEAEALQATNSLLNIGNILFKDARDPTPSELGATKAYLKSTFKKI
jgi:hypothetical protein